MTTAVVTPKIRREIQPKDDAGNPIGQPHVYEGETEQEVADKMAEAIAHGTRKINELSRKVTLEPQTFTAPDGADPEEQIAELKPRDLTEDQRFTISNKFKDPATVQEAFDELAEARFGAKPVELVKQTNSTYKNSAATRAHAEANAFAEEHPEFIICKPNSDAMMQYVSSRKMALTKKNFNIAFEKLSADGLLKLKVQEPVLPAPAKEEVRTDPPTEPVQKTVIPRALTRSDSSGTAPAKPKKPSAAEIAMMTSDQYKKYLGVSGVISNQL